MYLDFHGKTAEFFVSSTEFLK